MRVTKRNGELQDVSFDKILERVKKLGQESGVQINFSSLVVKVIDQLYDTISTATIDELAAEQCASLSHNHYYYSILASRILISNYQKNTKSKFSEVISSLYNFKNFKGEHNPIVSTELWNFTNHFSQQIDEMIDHSRDYLIDYFGFKTLANSYLLKINNINVERIQHMFMRVAIGIHGNKILEENLYLVKETYDLMSQKYFIHATPTLYNAGTPYPQLSSCFLIAMENDSIDGIFNTLKDCALISQYSGGIGLHIHNIRAKDSYIQSTNGKSDGIVPMLRVFNNTARYVNQSGKRKGSFAIYLEPWHVDIEDFLQMKNNHGNEELKARDLFYALWICDLFMKRVVDDKKWSLFCPNECPGLSDVYGNIFEELYEQYESEGKARKTMNARDLWTQILDSQMETGTPYILFKDAVNSKSNQQNIGTIKGSNLCCEIMQYSDKTETAVCNLASINLSLFVNENTKEFDYNKLHSVTKVVTNNLNCVIDINFYPIEKTKNSNLKHRPIGIGIQGLADAFCLMDIPFYSNSALEVNKQIFETIYHAALEKSNENAKLFGSYDSFQGSPASKGILQFDMWNVTPSNRYDWNTLKLSIIKYGLRNSLLTAPMPTATTSQIFGSNECFEPFTSNAYTRKVLAGDYIVANKYLIKDLISLNLWNKDIADNIVKNNGSIQQLSFLPEHIKNKYKISWEIPMKHIINMSADRGAFICQSQSLNLWVQEPTYSLLGSMHIYSWKKGLKTGMYYLRRKAKHQPQQFTIEPNSKQNIDDDDDDDDICHSCSA